VADAGYANAEHLQLLADVGQTAYLATREHANNQGEDKYYQATAFSYDRERDCPVCPTKALMRRKQIMRKENCMVYVAPAESCASCTLKPQCTAKQRFVKRLLYAATVEANARRVAAQPEMMKLRRRTVEHPFGTIEHEILRNARLLTRGLKGAKGELSSAVLAYNLKRLTNWKGTNWG
jgi:hypothetical protein